MTTVLSQLTFCIKFLNSSIELSPVPMYTYVHTLSSIGSQYMKTSQSTPATCSTSILIIDLYVSEFYFCQCPLRLYFYLMHIITV